MDLGKIFEGQAIYGTNLVSIKVAPWYQYGQLIPGWKKLHFGGTAFLFPPLNLPMFPEYLLYIFSNLSIKY